MEKMAEYFRPDTWSLLMVDEGHDEPYFAIAVGDKAEALKSVRLKMGEGIAGWVAKHGEARVVPDVHTDPVFASRVDETTKCETRQVICVPLRLIDFAFRYGGDEFVVLLPQTGKDSALVVAKRLRDGLRASSFCREEGLNLNVRASIGLATYPHDARTAHDVIRQADGMMYVVKNSTRDNIGIAQRGMLKE